MCFNKSVLYMAILSFCGMCSYPILVTTGSLHARNSDVPCRNTLENQADSEHAKGIVQECLKLYPLKDPNESSSIEDSERILEENQSNCALKCINESLNVTSDEGLIDVSKIQQHFLQNRNLTRSYVLKLAEIMSDCERKAGEAIEADGGVEQNSCKYHVLFIHCYSDAYMASRQEIHKCNESTFFLLNFMKALSRLWKIGKIINNPSQNRLVSVAHATLPSFNRSQTGLAMHLRSCCKSWME